MEEIHLLHLKNVPILTQLQIEESLLKADERNFCVLNQGTPPAIVMGISGKAESLIFLERLKEWKMPLIKRFTGGGTVVVDEDTLFVSFIIQKKEALKITQESIHQWTSSFYQKVFDHPEFSLLENDYVLGVKKMGGNAQYIRKSRFLHHTSFLWSYDKSRMSLLKMPPKIPNYREARSHEAFLCKLEDHLPSKDFFFDRIQTQLKSHFTLKTMDQEEVLRSLERPHRKSVELIEY